MSVLDEEWMPRFALSVIAFSFVFLGFAQDTTSSAVVVVTAGSSWSAGGKTLSRAQQLALGRQLTKTGNAEPDLILDCGKAGWLSYRCGPAPCSVSACQTKIADITITRVDLLPNNGAESRSSGDSWFASLFKREPATLAVLGVREGGHLTDSVIDADASDLRLGPALNRVLEGKYCLRFSPLPGGEPGASKQAPLAWDRDTDPAGTVHLTGIRPGLYEVQKSGSEAAGACDFEADAIPAWILVAKPSDFPALKEQWTTVVTRLHDLEEGGASPTVLLTVRHAALAHLADSVQASKHE